PDGRVVASELSNTVYDSNLAGPTAHVPWRYVGKRLPMILPALGLLQSLHGLVSVDTARCSRRQLAFSYRAPYRAQHVVSTVKASVYQLAAKSEHIGLFLLYYTLALIEVGLGLKRPLEILDRACWNGVYTVRLKPTTISLYRLQKQNPGIVEVPDNFD